MLANLWSTALRQPLAQRPVTFQVPTLGSSLRGASRAARHNGKHKPARGVRASAGAGIVLGQDVKFGIVGPADVGSISACAETTEM